MASFDPNTRLDARELDYISNQLDLRQLFRLEQNLYIHEGIPFEVLERQYNGNVDALSGMLFTWHSNQNPANERRLMVNALNQSSLISLAETIRMGGCHTVPQGMSTDQHHETGNAVVSNLNMGALPGDFLELKSVSMKPSPQELLKLSPSSETPLLKLARQYEENADPCSEMLNTWHSNQDQAKERGSQKEAFKENTLDCLAAEKVQMGGCHTVPQGMSTDQHHATGNAVVSNLNMGALLDDELKSVSKQPGPQELLKLSPSSETPLVKLARQYEENADPCSEMLNTWHSNQDPAKEIRLMINSSGTCLDSLAEKDQMGEQRALQPSSAQHPEILQQPDIAPMQIHQQTSFELTEIKLRDVSKELGAEWRMVGTYLGLKNSQIEVMQEQYPVVKECIFQMLLKWRNTNDVKATKTELKSVLRRSLREDLVDLIDEADDCVLKE